ERGLALRLGEPPVVARDFLRAHSETYAAFWEWSDRVVDYAVIVGSIYSVFGWSLHLGVGANPRALRNFPMQANGAEMLRLACFLGTRACIEWRGDVAARLLLGHRAWHRGRRACARCAIDLCAITISS